jgi:hypothetical protein
MKAIATTIFHTTPATLRHTMWGIVALILITLFTYGYFLRIAIGATVERGSTLHAIEVMNADIADLDASYVALEKDITLSRAIELGYHEVKNPSYITVLDSEPTLGIRERGGI